MCCPFFAIASCFLLIFGLVQFEKPCCWLLSHEYLKTEWIMSELKQTLPYWQKTGHVAGVVTNSLQNSEMALTHVSVSLLVVLSQPTPTAHQLHSSCVSPPSLISPSPWLDWVSLGGKANDVWFGIFVHFGPVFRKWPWHIFPLLWGQSQYAIW